MSTLLLFVVIFVLTAYFYKKAYKKPENFPPGPPRLPVYGSYWILLWQNLEYFHISLMQMAEKYKSKVLGFYLGPFACIATCDYETTHEVLRRPEFQARPDVLIARARFERKRHGVIFTDGMQWVDQRRFFLRHMRDFGFGRRFDSVESVMQQEAKDIVELLHGDWKDEDVCRGGRVLFSRLFSPYALNAMWCMFGGDRYARSDHRRLRVVSKGAIDFMQCTESTGLAVSMTPWLEHLSPRGFGIADIQDANKPMTSFVKKAILEHKATYSDDHMRDFIDMYLRKMKTQDSDQTPRVYNDDELILLGMDMVLATSSALPGSLAFLFHCLLHHPDIQKKIQKEIDDVVGRDKQPTLDDRQRMPYLEATLRESMRRVTIAPLSVPHLSTEDTYLRGYFVPKFSVIYPNLWAAHMDPAVWGDPENFRPERFLDETGNLKKKDISLPFGAGKRLCAGETFSRQMMFIVTAFMLQHFSFEPESPDTLPPMDSVIHGFTLTAPDVWGKVIPRD